MSRRAATALAAALAAALALTACQPARREPKVVVETRYLEELSTAIEYVNEARQAFVNDANAIGTAAAAVDDVDDAAVQGNRDAVRARRGPAENAMRRARAAAARLRRDHANYTRAVTTLDGAPREGLDAAQVAALADVVAAARAELSRLRGYATVIASIWPRYEKLNEHQALWLTRWNGGWYRDAKEAAGAYTVLTDRAALARDRRSLAGADKRRLAAARAVDAEMAKARGALASLLD